LKKIIGLFHNLQIEPQKYNKILIHNKLDIHFYMK